MYTCQNNKNIFANYSYEDFFYCEEVRWTLLPWELSDRKKPNVCGHGDGTQGLPLEGSKPAIRGAHQIPECTAAGQSGNALACGAEPPLLRWRSHTHQAQYRATAAAAPARRKRCLFAPDNRVGGQWEVCVVRLWKAEGEKRPSVR